MAGESDLAAMLAGLRVDRRAALYTFVTGDWPSLVASAAAVIDEDEGPTLIVPVEAADAAGAPIGFRAAWLTLTVHSALDSVGLTAVVSAALAGRGIATNVVAGYHHDHLLVPWDRATEAVTVLEALGEVPSPPVG